MKYGDFVYVSNTEFWDFYLNDLDSIELLKFNVKKKDKIRIFKKFVTVINLELSSFCNRKCVYCPVSNLEKKTKEYISNDIFNLLMAQLKHIKFSGIITMNLFNEPLSNPDYFVDRLHKIKIACPSSYVRINTNGDYLNEVILNRIRKAGINEILLTLHTVKGEEYSDDLQKKKLLKKIDSLGLTKFADLKRVEKNKNITFECILDKLRILLVSNNWSLYGVDRGGTIDRLSIQMRDAPCLVPFREVTIDYRGFVLWCYNIFRDETYSFSNISDEEIVDIYFKKSYVNLRRKLITYSKKESICRTCNVDSHSKLTTRKQRSLLIESVMNKKSD
tara:strand:+ start:177 stop:1175 length:999 start_codon:yes stop_codon:yes gene_type:complete